MTFIPQTSYEPPRHSSLEAEDLAREIENTIVDFQKRRPRTNHGDIRQALNIIEMRAGVGRGSRQRPAMIVALLLGLLGALAFGIAMFAAAR